MSKFIKSITPGHYVVSSNYNVFVRYAQLCQFICACHCSLSESLIPLSVSERISALRDSTPHRPHLVLKRIITWVVLHGWTVDLRVCFELSKLTAMQQCGRCDVTRVRAGGLSLGLIHQK